MSFDHRFGHGISGSYEDPEPPIEEYAEHLVAHWWSIKEEWEETSLDELTMGELNDLGNKIAEHADKIVKVLNMILTQDSASLRTDSK